jgi:hypothetical protein
VPSWFARFLAQLMTDPALREIVVGDALTERPLRHTIDGLNRRLLTAPVGPVSPVNSSAAPRC